MTNKKKKKLWRVTEVQHIRYSWEVEASSEDEAKESAEDGVPDNAHEDMFYSETEAEEI